MGHTSESLLARYQAVRRPLEVAFWLVVISAQCALNTAVAIWDARAAQLNIPAMHLLLWEASSHLVVLGLIPVLVAWERRYPLHWDSLVRHLPWHIVGSIGFSVLHVALMVALRHAAHAALGGAYAFGDWLAHWPYEYLKDVRAYALIVGALAAYRALLLRWQGEARVLDAPELALATPSASAHSPAMHNMDTHNQDRHDQAEAQAVERPQRFLVRKLKREFLIAASDIEWVQAQANYVGLRVGGRDYLLRSSLAEFMRQLEPTRFVQVHRSYVVNLDQIAEIQPQDSGDAKLLMRSGATLPCSRRYRAALSRA